MRLWSHDGGVYRAPAGAHATYELAWVEEGELRYRIGSVDHVVRAGEAFLVPGGVEHTTWFDAPTRAGALALGDGMVEQLADALGRRATTLEAGVLVGPLPIATLGRALRIEASNAEAGHLHAIESIAETMTIAMIRSAATQPGRVFAGDPRIRSAIERVHASYADPIQVDDLAAAAGMSRFHFSRLFRDATGHSPYQYLLHTRIERAAERLRGGSGASVTEVAFSVGFGDLGRFARSFRAVMGATPAAYAAGTGLARRRPG